MYPDGTLFQDFVKNLQIRAETKRSEAVVEKEIQLKALRDALVRVIYPCGRALCEELQEVVSGTSSGLSGDFATFSYHALSFTFEVKDTGLGPRILRQVTAPQAFKAYRERDYNSRLSGADFEARHLVASDVDTASVRTHIFACLKEVLAYEYKDKI